MFRDYFPAVMRLRPGRHWRTKHPPVGWPLITQYVIPLLYDYLRPYYPVRRYRHRRKDLSGGAYPVQLRRDIMEILQLKLPHLTRELTVERVTAAIQRYRSVAPKDPPRGGAHVAYSPYLLSGVLRCGRCGARMVAQTTTRKKGTDVYRCGVYRCGFAKTKGPAVCPHGTGYRQERLVGALLTKFREAMTAPMIEALASMVNAQLEARAQRQPPEGSGGCLPTGGCGSPL